MMVRRKFCVNLNKIESVCVDRQASCLPLRRANSNVHIMYSRYSNVMVSKKKNDLLFVSTKNSCADLKIQHTIIRALVR